MVFVAFKQIPLLLLLCVASGMHQLLSRRQHALSIVPWLMRCERFFLCAVFRCVYRELREIAETSDLSLFSGNSLIERSEKHVRRHRIFGYI